MEGTRERSLPTYGCKKVRFLLSEPKDLDTVDKITGHSSEAARQVMDKLVPSPKSGVGKKGKGPEENPLKSQSP